MSNGGTLSQDIVTDILSRLPVQYLCRFKCVSPSWKSLISDPHFAKTHLNRTKSTQNDPKNLDQKIIIISNYHNLYSVDFAEVNRTATNLEFPAVEHRSAGKWVQVLSSCDGLLLVSRDDNSDFLFLNPSTREHKELPTFPFVLNSVHCFHSYLYGMGYDSSADDYKVLMLSSYNTTESEPSAERDSTMVAIYSLKTNAWRRIQDTNYILVGNSCGVFLNGCLHCLCWRAGSKVIVAFDLSGEIFKEVPLPTSFGTYTVLNYHVAVVGGCLCLVDQRSHRTQFWMMKEYEVRESWLKFTFDICDMSRVKVLCLLPEDNFLLKTKGFIKFEKRNTEGNGVKLIVYNSKKETQRDMVVHGLPTEFMFGSTYVESLVSPNHGGLGGDE
ncbi:F-box/kelch-repeat protein At3g06240-like [Rhododendron vialii]|uniref:F-box/kelch-repeat protein At3g06240-like n=1 Tax=Rhododendron vialii TaxID=182163 RepID=UPI00265D790C|nr:F-box/kelch-repeat protein At3g06240-like [Rhododendron vialii]